MTGLNSDGAAQWSFTADHPNVQFDDIVGHPGAPWLIGHGWSDASGGTVLWVQRVDRTAARATHAACDAAPAVGAARDATAAELKPITGCSCGCEEFARFQADMEPARNLSREEQMSLMGNPQFMARMECMASCAMQYAGCSR